MYMRLQGLVVLLTLLTLPDKIVLLRCRNSYDIRLAADDGVCYIIGIVVWLSICNDF